jgi:hypothetical protein
MYAGRALGIAVVVIFCGAAIAVSVALEVALFKAIF